MGTPAQATKFNELNGQVDLWMLSAIVALVSIGLVMVASSSMPATQLLRIASRACPVTCSMPRR